MYEGRQRIPPAPPTYTQEESRLARDVAAAEERSAADEVARKQRLHATIAAMDRSNKQQLQRKAEQRAHARAEEMAHLDAWQVCAWARVGCSNMPFTRSAAGYVVGLPGSHCMSEEGHGDHQPCGFL